MVVLASEYRARMRKEVEAPSGFVFEIRKLAQEDFVPRGLVALTIEAMEQVPNEVARDYLKKHPEEVLDIEKVVLVKGVTRPRLSATPTEDERVLHVEDVDAMDRKFLFQVISEFSGITMEGMAQVDKFRPKKLDGAGGDGEVLQEAPV